MTGTVIITGANGSCALAFVEHILSAYPSYTLLATVRDASPSSDPNTARLDHIIESNKSSNAHIEALDLSKLSAVREFAASTAQRIADGKLPPIKAIVCNAFTSSFSGQRFTDDGYEKTFQVNHLSHYLLVLKLLGSMASNGRIVMLGSNTHYTDRPHPLYKLRAEFPQDINELIRPDPDEKGQEHDRGFQRYGNSKLANIMFMHDLSVKLSRDPKLSGIKVTAVDPGGLVDSRANEQQKLYVRFVFGIIYRLLPLINLFTKAVRSAASAGRDLAIVAVSDSWQGREGYYEIMSRAEEDAVSRDVEKRDVLWKACWEWTGLRKEEVALVNAAP
ncbi:hypothetical protein F66182_1197 [Fusarium sp. NRRL 66182]|nr:hypothetical protein F66182_1197 [Fusarium sp. NRRL 66182]